MHKTILMLVAAMLLFSQAYFTPVNAAPAPKLQGDVVQGAMVVGKAAANARVWLNDSELQVSTAGHFVFGIGKDDVGAVQLRVAYGNGAQWQQEFAIAEREFAIQRVDGLPQRTVTPNPEVQALIRADNAKIGAARNVVSERLNFSEGFIWPAAGRISGVYGSQRILNGNPSAPHWGLDIAAPTGTPVYAPAGGEVRLTAADMVLSGGTIIIDHGHNIFSSFLHLHEIHVAEGQIVTTGDLIGEIGATGRATGPHLDWRMNWGGVRVDPQLLVPSPEPPQL